MRKANIIKSLKMMGYLVGENSGIYSVALRTGSGRVVLVIVPEEDLILKDNIIEEIVCKINCCMVRDF